LLLIAAATLTSGGGWGSPWADRLTKLPASVVEPGLPDQAFGLWFKENFADHLPGDAVDSIEFGPCGARDPGCMTMKVEIASRARTLVLRFDRDTHAFSGGSIGGPELEQGPPITSLAELPARLSEAHRPYPLDCPEGTALRLREEHAGLFEWCEGAEGVKQGPARAWFSTGRYLMYRGGFVAGERHGPWFECDRFERCRNLRYVGGARVPLQTGD
jgi:hypothetical protein